MTQVFGTHNVIDATSTHPDDLRAELERLATAGRLPLTDPQRAARQFLAVINDDALARSGVGTTVLTADDVAGLVPDPVDIFLAAFRAKP